MQVTSAQSITTPIVFVVSFFSVESTILVVVFSFSSFSSPTLIVFSRFRLYREDPWSTTAGGSASCTRRGDGDRRCVGTRYRGFRFQLSNPRKLTFAAKADAMSSSVHAQIRDSIRCSLRHSLTRTFKKCCWHPTTLPGRQRRQNPIASSAVMCASCIKYAQITVPVLPSPALQWTATACCVLLTMCMKRRS